MFFSSGEKTDAFFLAKRNGMKATSSNDNLFDKK